MQTTDIPECICNTTHAGICRALTHIELDSGKKIPRNRHERRAEVAKKRKPRYRKISTPNSLVEVWEKY